MSDDERDDQFKCSDRRPNPALHSVPGETNQINMSVTIKTSIGDIDMSPLVLDFNAPLIGTEPSIGEAWASQISQEVKKAVASLFESKYGRRRTMATMGTYADAQKQNANAIADEKSYPSYEKMSKSWAGKFLSHGGLTSLPYHESN